MITFKKIALLSLSAVLTLSLAACGKAENGIIKDNASPGIETPAVSVDELFTNEGISAVLHNTYGDNYLPSEQLDAQTINSLFNLEDSDYDAFYAEVPMISVHADEVYIFKAADTAKILESLNKYRDAEINQSMQYPINLPKIAASQVYDFGNGVVGYFVLGGYIEDADIEADETKSRDYYASETQRGIDALADYFATGNIPEASADSTDATEAAG